MQTFSRTLAPTRVTQLFVLSLLVILGGCGPNGRSNTPQSGGQAQLAEEGRVYGLVSTRAEASALQLAARDLGYLAQEAIPLAGLNMVMVPVDLPTGVTGAQAIGSLESEVPVSTVGVNHAYRLQQVQPRGDLTSVSDRRMFANEIIRWPNGGCRAKRSIGLIDGGVSPSAPALANIDLRVREFANGSAQSRRHGTEVATVLVNRTRISDVTLFSVNVVETNRNGEDLAGAAALVQAIDWLARQDVDLVNISLAGPQNKLLARAVKTASDNGIQLVAAVGNNGPNAEPQHPAALPSVIAVTAVDAMGQPFRNAVRGAHVDFAAPGVDVFVSTDSGERYVSGTSIAAPFITSYLATMDQNEPEAMRQGALDLGASGRDPIFGNGLLQAFESCS